MARIRTIKPEFFTSEQIVECSTNARLLFVGMWCFCDDRGVHPASLKRLKMEVFPGDSFTESEVAAMVEELIRHRLIGEFEADGDCFWFVTGWHHQKIDRPNPKYPEPPKRAEFDEHSTNAQRVSADDSTTIHPRKGRESKGKEGNVSNTSAAKPRRVRESFDAKSIEIPEALNTPAFNASWAEWIDYLNAKRKRPTEATARKQLASMEAVGVTAAVAAIDKSISAGWTGVFPESQGTIANGSHRGRAAVHAGPGQTYQPGQGTPAGRVIDFGD